MTEPGTYSYKATVSSGTTGSAFTIALKTATSTTNLARINVQQTGNNDWGTYKVQEGKLTRKLSAGEQIFRITINGANCNIDKIELICTESDGIDGIKADTTADGPAYNLSGQQVADDYRGIIIKNGKKIFRR